MLTIVYVVDVLLKLQQPHWHKILCRKMIPGRDNACHKAWSSQTMKNYGKNCALQLRGVVRPPQISNLNEIMELKNADQSLQNQEMK